MFPPPDVPRDGGDDHDLVQDEDAVGPAGELEGRLGDDLQVAVMNCQDRSLGEDAGQDVQVTRGTLNT